MTDVCPRCGGTKFHELDCGPDSYDDDIAYSSDKCTNCGLWYDGWKEKWYIDVDFWQEVEDAEEFIVQEEIKSPLTRRTKGLSIKSAGL